MDYTVQLREDQEIVTARASGEWDSTTDNTMIREIMEMVEATNRRRVLLDIRELNFDLPIVQFFERANEMREERRQFEMVSTKAAIVYSSSNPKLEEDMLFFEKATRNRGLPYRMFKDIEDAMTWLMKES